MVSKSVNIWKFSLTIIYACSFAVFPTLAFASFHASLDPYEFIAAVLAVFINLSGIALLLAAYIFWKKQLFNWLLACVAMVVIPGSLQRLVNLGVLLGYVTSPVKVSMILSPVTAIVYWAILLIAIFIKRKN